MEFCKLKFLEFTKLENEKNFRICSISKTMETPKISKFLIVRSFIIPHYPQLSRSLYFPFDLNKFRCFSFLIFIFYSSHSRNSKFRLFLNLTVRNYNYLFLPISTIYLCNSLSIFHIIIKPNIENLHEKIA